VVAWHNRHVLAERIAPTQVQAAGWVALPFRSPTVIAADGTPEAEPRRGWIAAFTEDFIAPLAPRRIARFALRHGSTSAPTDGLPVREVDIERALTMQGHAATLWLRTAAIETGTRRVRVLLAADASAVAIGPRLWSRLRAQAAAALVALTLAAAAVAPWSIERAASGSASTAARSTTAAASRPGATQVPPVRVVATAAATAEASAAAATPAKAASAATTPSSAPTEAVAAVASAPAAAASVSASASSQVVAVAAQATDRIVPPPRAAPTAAVSARAGAAPASFPPLFGHPRARQPDYGVRPHIGASLDDVAKARARAEVQAARAAHGTSPAATNTAHGPDATRSADAAHAAGRTEAAARVGDAPAASPHAPVWAVSTRSLRTRFESEQLLVAMRDVAGRGDSPGALRFEVLPAGDDWRAVTWPYAERRDAERVRAGLQERGLRVEVVPF